MAEKCYKVQFTANLHKLTLALKIHCNIEIIWKRGEKICESGKFPLDKGIAVFNKNISICCNMMYDPKTKIFQQKKTKFSIILSRDNETKQAGEIIFDVAEYVNERQLNKKDFELKLSKCPDKNAKLSFTICGVFREQLDSDNISHLSEMSSFEHSAMLQAASQSMIMSKGTVASIPAPKSMITPKKQNKIASSSPTIDKSLKTDDKCLNNQQKLIKFEQQNQKLKQELKKMQKIRKQNEQLRKKIKQQDFNKVKEIKQKMDKMREQIQHMKGEIKTHRNLERQTKTIENDILKCKIKIMKALNFCAEFGGSNLLNSVQDYCGMLEK